MNRRVGKIAAFIVLVMLALAGQVSAQGRGRRPQAPPIRPPASPSTFRATGVPNPATTPGVFINRSPSRRAQRSFILAQPYFGFYAPYVSPVSPVIAAPIYPEPVYVPSASAQRESELAVEVQRLSHQVEQLRREQALAPPAALPPPQPAPTPAAQPTPSTPKVLIFRDGSRKVFYSYMVSGEALWVTDPGNSTKIPLADLDLEATERENRGQGLRFLRR
jgi:hypothetical protein